RRIGSGGFDDDRVVHRAEVRKRLDYLGHRRCLLADRDVNTNDVFALLVDDRIDGDRGLASLPVADNKLTLATPDRHHCIDGFQSCLQWLLHRLSVDYTRRDPFNWVVLFGDDWTSIVNRVAEHVDHAANH